MSYKYEELDKRLISVVPSKRHIPIRNGALGMNHLRYLIPMT